MLDQKFLGPLDSDNPDRDINESIRDCLNLVPQVGGRGASPRRESLKGTTAIANTLPAGTNKTVGQFIDKNSEQVFYFNYNSNNDHGIYLYDGEAVFKIMETSLLNFTEQTVISGAGVVDETLIWTDGVNPIRGFNYKYGLRDNNAFEAKTWELIVDIADPNLISSANTLTITTGGGPTNIALAGPATKADIDSTIDSWVTLIDANGDVSAERCGDSITITELVADNVSSVQITAGVIAVSATNHYVGPLTEREITLANEPPQCEPSFQFVTDSTKKQNLVRGRQFQFRTRHVYFDNSKSTLSPISPLAYSKFCIGGDTANNCIEVTFNDVQYTQRELTLVKNIEVYFREGNNGSWYLADSLSRNEYLNGKYNFCNDGVYQILDDETAGKNFDSVPLKANGLAVIDNRVFLGATTEGYDTPCVDANIEVDILDEDTSGQLTWTVEGLVRIINNVLNSAAGYRESQPIWRGEDSDGQVVFGGFGPSDYVNKVGQKFDQWLPQGGFTVYLAGTQHRATSKQVFDVTGAANDLTLPPYIFDAGGPGDAATKRDPIRDVITGAGSIDPQSAYSRYSIPGVKPGRYILRVASHKCYEGQKPDFIDDPTGIYQLNDSLRWQQTSTTVVRTDEPITTALNSQITIPQDTAAQTPEDVYEIVLELGTPSFDGEVYDVSDMLDEVITVADNSDPRVGFDREMRTFYVRDLNVAKEFDIEISKSVELADFFFDVINRSVKTDHNGFCFVSSVNAYSPKIYSGSILLKDDVDETMFEGFSIHDIGDADLTAETPRDDAGTGGDLKEYIVMAINDNVRAHSRTLVQGRVEDSSGNPISGALVLIDRTNEYDVTDSTGGYEILVFSESDDAGDVDTRDIDVFITVADSLCLLDNDPLEASKKVSDTITINSLSPPNNNNTNPFDNGTAVVDITNLFLDSKYKNGGAYQWAVLYYDDYLRSPVVSTNVSLRKTIPFYTEDLSVALPDASPGYPANTFKFGSPEISWTINSLPPAWATRWRWARTKNTQQGQYLTWLVNKVLYIRNFSSSATEGDIFNYQDIEETIYSNGDANEIYLNLDNIVTYNDNNPDSKIGYDFKSGDRVIIFKNNGEFLEEYFDFRIKGQNAGSIVIEAVATLPELKGQVEIQIYSPREQTDQQVYYEIGPCYDIVGGFHKGGTQDQTAVLPATGVFSDGDTYKISRNVNLGVDIFNTDPNVDPEDFQKTFGSQVNIQQDHHAIDDSIDSMDQDIGRVNLESKEAKQQFLFSNIRFSNRLVQNTQVNGVKTFDEVDAKPLPAERGIIRVLVSTHDNLLAIHETESSSVYVNERFLRSPDGAGNLSQTDDVVGDDRLLRGEFGTINPESVVEWNDNIFWWDDLKAEPVMYSINGIEKLGTLRNMRNYFLNLQKTRRDHLIANPSDFSRVYGGYDPEKKMFILSFNDMGALEGDTIGYNDDYNYFSTRFSFKPEHFSYLINNFFSFKDGALWKHDDDDVNFNRFYGVDYPWSFKFVSNSDNHLEKIYRSIGAKINKEFQVIEISNPEGQLSTLVTGDLVRRDDQYYADILRDENTNPDKLVGIQTPLLHGDVMRSQVMTLEFRSDDDEEANNPGQVFVEYIVVDYQESPGHILGSKR